ncbi:Alpha-galactosidase 1 [Dichanthelium oligosanthes]|uniref:Alpha-galactosidase n=1 Tax=Dichanthelium oligosanthes TaxID=888268 RepID=A0A1E5VIS6_9POAL|nr:Alpha-galactosidase 1 [Dichanthelium oligosanthes]
MAPESRCPVPRRRCPRSPTAVLLLLLAGFVFAADARPLLPTGGGGGARRGLLDNGLGLTPQMGWNSWNHFQCDINETLVRSTAYALVATGLAKAGYTYVNLDDCWADNQRTKEDVDYLKYDNCYPDGTPETLSRSIRGYMDVARWGGTCGNSWRTTGDINDTWSGDCNSMLDNIDLNDAYAHYAKPGGWNDPDMLEVGNGGMTYNEYVVHFSLWAIAKAPLIIGCDVTSISNETLGILSNAEVIAINQDRLGIQGKKVRKYDNDLELTRHRKAVLLLNRGATRSASVTAAWPDVGIRPGVAIVARDVWKHETLPGKFTDSLTAVVDPHLCKLFVLTPVPR